MGIYFASKCIRNTTKSFQYFGQGYRYVLRSDGPMGTRAFLRLPQAMLDLFVAKCGRINTVEMSKHLEVWHQGNGWYMITTLNEEFASFVTRFLARLNRWMFKRNREQDRPTVQQLVQVNNALHMTYQLILPIIPHKPPTPQAMQGLAKKFSHYDHATH